MIKNICNFSKIITPLGPLTYCLIVYRYYRRSIAVSEEQPVDHLRDHLVRRGVRAPGQVRHLRQGAQLHRLDRADHRPGGEQSTIEHNSRFP